MLKCNQIWQNFATLANFILRKCLKHWQILIVINGQMLKNNLAIRSHCWAAWCYFVRSPFHSFWFFGPGQCDQIKIAKVYKMFPKLISIDKWFFGTFTKLPKNVGDLGKIIVAKGFEWLPKGKKCPIWSHWSQDKRSFYDKKILLLKFRFSHSMLFQS